MGFGKIKLNIFEGKNGAFVVPYLTREKSREIHFLREISRFPGSQKSGKNPNSNGWQKSVSITI